MEEDRTSLGGKTKVNIRAVLIGLVVSVVVSILVLLVAELLVPPLERAVPEASSMMRAIAAMAATLVGLLAGGYVAGRRTGRDGALNGALVGLISFSIPILLALVFSPEEAISRVSVALYGAGAQIGTGAVGGYLGAVSRRRSEAARVKGAGLGRE